jgi:glycerol-3-phosphate dehydrogenase (NAD(P)+)
VAAYAVLGATSWGLTLATLLARGGAAVRVLTRTAEEAAALRARHGLARLPEVVLDDAIAIEPAPAAAPAAAGLIIAVPTRAFATSLALLAGGWREVPALSAAKGIETATGRRMSEVLAASGWEPELVAALSGPNLAHEVARGLPAAAVVAAHDAALAERWQRALAGPAFRVYRSDDVTGVEIAGASKNVVAIAAGAAAGLEFGANTVAALLTRGLAEMARLGVALGANEATFLGLAGVGDLAATCFSPLSRNHRLGELLARGQPTSEAIAAIGEAVEGAAAAPALVRLAAAAGVEMPIADAVSDVIEGRRDVRQAMADLLTRELTTELRARR